MTSVQERLKLKRAQIDTWSIREQLCLASSVLRSGDQNWMSVSRSLKAFGDPERPPDWFSQKSCAVQYSNLLEKVETPKRKKRTDKGDKGDTSVETPSESIVRRLTQERIEELKRLLSERRQAYAKLKEEVMLVKSGNADDRLSEMCQEIEEEKRQKERKAEAHERWLKEREEKKAELERAWKPPVAPASPHRRKHHPKIHRRNSSQSEPSSEAESALDSPLSEPLNVDVIGEETVQEAAVEPEPSQTPTSPLLTSLLKSPSPAPSSQGSSILHSAITSHRGASPTITSLLSSAPGVPVAGNMVTVAPPTTVSSSLKNLVSSAISSEQPHHQPPPHNPSPAAGAPTLSMLLELPPSLPGKPLPELPSAVKTTTLPPSTMSAIVSTAITSVATSEVPKIVAVRAVTTAETAPTTSKITLVSSNDSNEVQSSIQDVKIGDSTSRDEDIEVLHVDSTQNSEDTQQMPIETKEELIEEVLIEEVVVNDDSVIESELLNSQISDVVVTTEQEDIKEKPNKNAEDINLDESFIEVSQSTEVVSQKEDIQTEVVADVDSTSCNSGLPINVGSSNATGEKDNKDDCIEAIIETSSQELVSEIVTEEASGVEVIPGTEEELTSGAVAEVIEITDVQETTIQTEVLDECGPCMQELEDMEVIILDKVQGLDDVQIVEDMKELECEVVEVVMGTQEKVDDEIKEDSGELVNDSVKPEDVESCSVVSDTIIECKSTDGADIASNSKSDISPTPQGEEHDNISEKVENEILNDDIPSVEEGIEEEEEKSDSISCIATTENGYETEDSSGPHEIIVEEVYEEEKEEEQEDDDPETEELCEDVRQDVTVSTSDSPIELESNGDLDIKESEDKDADEIQVCEVEEEVGEDAKIEEEEKEEEDEKEDEEEVEEEEEEEEEEKEDEEEEEEKEEVEKEEEEEEKEKEKEEKEKDKEAKDNIAETQDIVDHDSLFPNTELKEDKEQSTKKESTTEYVEDIVKEEQMNKEVLKKDINESQKGKKDIPQEPSKTNDTSKKDSVPRDLVKKDDSDEVKKDMPTKEQKELLLDNKHLLETEHKGDDMPKVEGKVSCKDIPKGDLQKSSEGTKNVTKEVPKKDGEKINVKEKDISKKENFKKDVQSPAREIVKEPIVKEIKKDAESKDKKEVPIVLSKDSVKNDVQMEKDIKKPTPCKEIPKKDTTLKREVPAYKKDIHISKRDLHVSKKETYSAKKDLQVKEVPKEISNKRELLRRDSKEDVSKKEVLKHNVTKEGRRETLKDDARKKPHIQEVTKPLKKVDSDAKSNDIIKPEQVAKIEKNKKQNEFLKEESKEVKREKFGKDSLQNREDKSNNEQPVKESKIRCNSSKLKSYGEETNKPTSTIEKKDGKEHKEIEKYDSVPKQESLEHSDEKPEKRPQLRSETPSTEDDKTNDAEPPKVIGRKRLAAVNVMDSVPNSPASTTDEEREYKSWKKSIMLLYGRLATHKYASLFLRPITDDQAPGYSSVVHRPIDLLTIKKNIETGVIRTTPEFQRDVMLMFLNSIMYNKSNHLVHKMAKQMQQEAMQHIQDFITTQMLVQAVGDGVPMRRETRTTEANKQRDILGNPSNVSNQDESESSQLHKRKRYTPSDSSERGFKKKKVDE